jgi:hypothetical protein
MKNPLTLLVILSSLFASSLYGLAMDQSSGLVRSIQENADAINKNAVIRQWKRVHLEVGRIVSDDQKLDRSEPSISKGDADDLHHAVSALRSAAADNDVVKTENASERVWAVCHRLLERK